MILLSIVEKETEDMRDPAGMRGHRVEVSVIASEGCQKPMNWEGEVDLEPLQIDLNEYMTEYNYKRTHQGKRCQGRTPMETFLEGKKLFVEKNLNDRIAA